MSLERSSCLERPFTCLDTPPIEEDHLFLTSMVAVHDKFHSTSFQPAASDGFSCCHLKYLYLRLSDDDDDGVICISCLPILGIHKMNFTSNSEGERISVDDDDDDNDDDDDDVLTHFELREMHFDSILWSC